MNQFTQNTIIPANKIQSQQFINQNQPIASQPLTTRVINGNVGFSKDIYRKVIGNINNDIESNNPSTRVNTVCSKQSYNSNHFVLPQEKLINLAKHPQNIQTNLLSNQIYQQVGFEQRQPGQLITPQNAINQTHSSVNTARSSNINVVINSQGNKHLTNGTDNFLSARDIALEQRCSRNQKQLQQLQNSIKPILAQKNIQNEINTKAQQVLKVSVNQNQFQQQKLGQNTLQIKENIEQKTYQKEYTDYKNASKNSIILPNRKINLEVNIDGHTNLQCQKFGDVEKKSIIIPQSNMGEQLLTQRRSSIYFYGQDQTKYDFNQNNIYRQNDVFTEQQFQQSKSQQDQISSQILASQNYKNNSQVSDKNIIQLQAQQQQYPYASSILNNPFSVYSQINENLYSNRVQEDTKKIEEPNSSSFMQTQQKISLNNTFQISSKQVLKADNSQFNKTQNLPPQNQFYEMHSQISQPSANQELNSRKFSCNQEQEIDHLQISVNQLKKYHDKTSLNGLSDVTQTQNSYQIAAYQPYLYLVPQKVVKQRNKTAISHQDQNLRNIKTSSNNLSVYMQTAYSNRSHDIATNNNQFDNSFLNEITPASTRSMQYSQLIQQQSNVFSQKNNGCQEEQQIQHLNQMNNLNNYCRTTRQYTEQNGVDIIDNNNFYQIQQQNSKQDSYLYNFNTNQSISQQEFQQIQNLNSRKQIETHIQQTELHMVNLNNLSVLQQDYSSYKQQVQKSNNCSYYQDQQQINNYDNNKSEVNYNTFQNNLNQLKNFDAQNYDSISKSIDDLLKNFNSKSNCLNLLGNQQLGYQINPNEQPFQKTECQIPIKRDSFSAAFIDQNEQSLCQNNYKTNTSSQRQSFLNGQNNSFNLSVGLEKNRVNNLSNQNNQSNFAQKNCVLPQIQLSSNKLIDDCKSEAPFSNRFQGVRKSSRSAYLQNQDKENDLVLNKEFKEIQIQRIENMQNQQFIIDTLKKEEEIQDIKQNNTQQVDLTCLKSFNNTHQIPNQTQQAKLSLKTFYYPNNQNNSTNILKNLQVDDTQSKMNTNSRYSQSNQNTSTNVQSNILSDDNQSKTNNNCRYSSNNQNNIPSNIQNCEKLQAPSYEFPKRRSCQSFLQPKDLEQYYNQNQNEQLQLIQGNQEKQNQNQSENQNDQNSNQQTNKASNKAIKKKVINTSIIKNLLNNVVESKSLSGSFRQSKQVALHNNQNSQIFKNNAIHNYEKQLKNNQSLNLIENSENNKNKIKQNNNQSANFKIDFNNKNSFNNSDKDEYREETNQPQKLNDITNNNKLCDINQQKICNNLQYVNQGFNNLESHHTDPGRVLSDMNTINHSQKLKKELIPQNLLTYENNSKEENLKQQRQSKSENEINKQASEINQNGFQANESFQNQNLKTQNKEMTDEQSKKLIEGTKIFNKRKLNQNLSQNFNMNEMSNKSFKNQKSSNSLTQTINLLLKNYNEHQSIQKQETKKSNENLKLKSARNSLEFSFKDSSQSNKSKIQVIQVVNKSLRGSLINSINSLSIASHNEQINNQIQQATSQNQVEIELLNQKKTLAEQQLRLSQFEETQRQQQSQYVQSACESSLQIQKSNLNSQRSQSEYEYRQYILNENQKKGCGITKIIQKEQSQIKQNNDENQQNLNLMTFCNKDQNFYIDELNTENIPPQNLNQQSFNEQLFQNSLNNQSVYLQNKSNQQLKNIKSHNQIIQGQSTKNEKENLNLINLNLNNSSKMHLVSNLPITNRNSSIGFFKENISPFSQPYSSTSNTSPSASPISLFNLQFASQSNLNVQVSFRQPPTLTIEEQIQIFDLEEKLKWPEIQLQKTEDVLKIIEIEISYAIDYSAFNKRSQFNFQSRFMIVDWMQRQCMKFYLKRETTHKAISYFDMYFSKTPNVKEDKYYIIAIACIFIASKQEEIYPPSLNDILSGSQYASQKTLISQQEIEIIKNLKWRLNPITACYWMDLAMAQWDKIQSIQNISNIYFRKREEQSYQRYREAYQFLDYILLDSNKMIYSLRLLSVTSLYLVICKNHTINPEQPNNKIDQILLENNYPQMFQLTMSQIKQCSKELVQFFQNLTYDYDYPNAIKQNNFNQKSYEEFLSYQSYSQFNKYNLENILRCLNN